MQIELVRILQGPAHLKESDEYLGIPLESRGLCGLGKFRSVGCVMSTSGAFWDS